MSTHRSLVVALVIAVACLMAIQPAAEVATFDPTRVDRWCRVVGPKPVDLFSGAGGFLLSAHKDSTQSDYRNEFECVPGASGGETGGATDGTHTCLNTGPLMFALVSALTDLPEALSSVPPCFVAEGGVLVPIDPAAMASGRICHSGESAIVPDPANANTDVVSEHATACMAPESLLQSARLHILRICDGGYEIIPDRQPCLAPL